MKERGVFFICLIFLVVSSYGQTWDNLKRLTYNSGESRSPVVAVDSSNVVHVVWYDNTNGTYDIYYKSGTHGGTGIWSMLKRLTWTSGSAMHPCIGIDPSNDNIHIVYTDNSTGNYELYHKMSTDGGSTWSSPDRITWSSGKTDYPSFVVDENGWLRLVYDDDTSGAHEVYYKERNGLGNWVELRRLSWSSGDAEYPWIRIDSNPVFHVVWQDNDSGKTQLIYKYSSDWGNSWSSREQITWSTGGAFKPKFEIDPIDRIRLSYYELIGGICQICYKENLGYGWVGYRRLTYAGSFCLHPTIAVGGADPYDLHVVYMYNNDLYHKLSTDQGASWSSPTRVTYSSNECWYPQLVIQGPNEYLRLVYYAKTPGNREVYFKRGSISSTTSSVYFEPKK